ncbi:CBS domain-containing protein [Streptomyces sp. WELS2]|uniref:CBS domain-containing protein n=1 Tax=Streptomyces sp. WELS2 TaxID=2749435 RepID=UPI0015F07DE7|nr:CBS domain-containing protein [Streptomyces sp. WELS2]
MNGSPALVNDVMTRRVVALREGAAFKDIVRTMQEWRVSALPVLDDDGRVVGVVSEADLLLKEEYGGDLGGQARVGQSADIVKANALTAAELMSVPAVTVVSGATLARAARIMAHRRIKRLPVVAPDGTLEGIVSRSDLLKVFLRDDTDIAEEVRREVVAGLFGTHADAVRVRVRDGVVTLAGRVPDTALVPIAARLARAMPGVVDVRCSLTGPPRHPDPDPDLPDARRTAPA